MSKPVKVKSTVKINRVAVAQINASIKEAVEKTAEALHTEVIQAQVMPFDTGVMQGQATHMQAGTTQSRSYPDGGTVTESISKASKSAKGIKATLSTASPQARRLYFHPEYNFLRTNNPNAGGKWYEPWISGPRKSFCSDAFAKFLKEMGVGQ